MSSVILYFIVYHALYCDESGCLALLLLINWLIDWLTDRIYFIITAAGVVFATAECRDDDSHLFMFPATDTNVLKSAFWSSGGWSASETSFSAFSWQVSSAKCTHSIYMNCKRFCRNSDVVLAPRNPRWALQNQDMHQQLNTERAMARRCSCRTSQLTSRIQCVRCHCAQSWHCWNRNLWRVRWAMLELLTSVRQEALLAKTRCVSRNLVETTCTTNPQHITVMEF